MPTEPAIDQYVQQLLKGQREALLSLALTLRADNADLLCEVLFRRAVAYELPYARLEFASYLESKQRLLEAAEVMAPDIAISETLERERSFNS